MKNRRDFLKTSALLAAGSMLAPQLLSSCTAQAKNIGLQLYSLRDMVGKEGIQAVLELVAGIGYKNLETAGYNNGLIYGMDPKEFTRMVGDLGMKFTSAHVGQGYSPDRDAEVMSWWDQAIAAHKEAGALYLVQPWVPLNENSSLDDLKIQMDYFNRVGEKAKAAGMLFGFHNHTVEFKKIGEEVIYDLMLAHTDPALVMFQLDVYWCQVGGSSPVEYLKNHPNRIKLTHIKDEKEIGASGTMDFEPIFRQMQANGINDWYVEVERYTNDDPKESVRESYRYLAEAKYLKK